jgi:hypothetical protein
VAGWTGVNTGAAWTATDIGGTIHAEIARTGTLNVRGLVKAQPSTPYTCIGHFHAQQDMTGTSGAMNAGLYFYDGTKLMGLEYLTGTTNADAFTIRVQKWTNITTASTAHGATSKQMGASPFGSGAWVRLVNNGTNLTFAYSLDGLVWEQIFSEAVGTFLTPTHYGFGGINLSTNTASILRIGMESIVCQ